MLLPFESLKSCIKDGLFKSGSGKKFLNKRLPIIDWLPKYNVDYAIGDLIAGVTVALTIIPQGLAYSSIVRVPPEHGLYSSFIGCIVYIFLGSCKDVSIGPTATLALITYQTIGNSGIQAAIFLCFLTGIIQIGIGVLGLGFLIDFISGPVSSGFTSAVALCIVTSQLKYIFDVPLSGTTFVDMWISLFKNLKDLQWHDTTLGFGCIFVLLLIRVASKVRVGSLKEGSEPSGPYIIINKLIWLIGIASNAIVVILSSFLSYMLYRNHEESLFKIIGHVPAGLPEVKPPPFSYTEIHNTTEIYHGFSDMMGEFGSGLAAVPLVALLENIAICKAFANGKAVDATQELLAIGTANVANSFFQGFPITGALARSALNHSSGVQTPLGGLYTAVLVLGSLIFFSPYFYYIPQASLAAIIIAAVIFMVEYQVVKPIWKTSKADLVPGLSTFIACLVLPLHYGILVGIGVNIMFVLYHVARPKLLAEKLTTDNGIEYLMLTPDRCLIFPSVDYVKNLVTKHSKREVIPVVINCTFIYKADYTAGTAVKILIRDFKERNQLLLFFNLKKSVNSLFEGLSSKYLIVFNSDEELKEIFKRSSILESWDISTIL